MKVTKLLAVPIMLGLILAGCSNSNDGEKKVKSASKKDIATLEIKDGSYVKLANSSGKETIELDVKVKNNSDSQFFIMEDSFHLIEKGDDEKILAKSLSGINVGSVSLYDQGINGDLSPDKSLSGKVFFDIEKDKEYTLNFQTNAFDKKTNKSLKEVAVPIDLKKMEDSKKLLDDPLKAFQAYVDVILLNKENEDYEKLVANNKQEEQQFIKQEFSKEMKNYLLSGNTSDEQIAKVFELYKKEQAEKFKVEGSLEQRLTDIAQVKVKISGMNSDALSNSIYKMKDEYYEKTGDFDNEKENNYVITNFEKILKEGTTNYLTDSDVTLVKKDGKWQIDMKSDDYYENKKLLRSYFGQSY